MGVLGGTEEEMLIKEIKAGELTKAQSWYSKLYDKMEAQGQTSRLESFAWYRSVYGS